MIVRSNRWVGAVTARLALGVAACTATGLGCMEPIRFGPFSQTGPGGLWCIVIQRDAFVCYRIARTADEERRTFLPLPPDDCEWQPIATLVPFIRETIKLPALIALVPVAEHEAHLPETTDVIPSPPSLICRYPALNLMKPAPEVMAYLDALSRLPPAPGSSAEAALEHAQCFAYSRNLIPCEYSVEFYLFDGEDVWDVQFRRWIYCAGRGGDSFECPFTVHGVFANVGPDGGCKVIADSGIRECEADQSLPDLDAELAIQLATECAIRHGLIRAPMEKQVVPVERNSWLVTLCPGFYAVMLPSRPVDSPPREYSCVTVAVGPDGACRLVQPAEETGAADGNGN